ncbi:MAG: hypothetical protein GJ671_00575 [Alteromonadaceae bacterium]|nr:hypothetical protein [Alteromonadaceae bacterium]
MIFIKLLLLPFYLIFGVLRNILSEGGHPFDGAYNDMVARQNEEHRKNLKERSDKIKKAINEIEKKSKEEPLWKLSKLTKISIEELKHTTGTYRKVNVKKKTGGYRELQIPNDQLKQVQKKLAKFINSQFKNDISPFCHSYRNNRGIISNSLPHLNCKVLVKLDVKDYFQNITFEQVMRELDLGFESIQFHPQSNFIRHNVSEPDSRISSYLASEEAQEILKKLVYSEQGLPQGAPTSPVISNLVLSDFDKEVYALVTSLNGAYTRYSDDITISFKEDSSQKIAQVIKFVEAKLAENGFKLNKKKGKINVLRPHQAQRICGVTINSGKPTISRKQRRLIRAAEHNAKQGKPTTFTEDQIKGHESFQKYIKEHGELLAGNERIQYLKTKVISARGCKVDKNFVILKGSQFDISKFDEAKEEFQTLFNQLKQEGVIVLKQNVARFKRNHQFKSKTLATSLLHLRNVRSSKWV